MNDSRRRVLVVGGGYATAVLLIISHLAFTMLGQGEDWLRRSYGNRWYFRNVPTKRGEIFDRQGTLLVRDEPTSSLEIHYRMFRRYHPIGVSVSCANLVLESEAKAWRYSLTPADARGAFRVCMAVPLSSLRRSETGPETSRDLRFYLSSLYAALTGSTQSRIFRAIRDLLDLGQEGSVCHALGLDPGELELIFLERLEELTEVGQRIDPERDLWVELQRCEDRRAESPRSEQIARTVSRRLDYELALFIARRKEWHPGLDVRPSVERVKDPLGLDLGSTLPGIVGTVTSEYAGEVDEMRRDKIRLEILPELEGMAADRTDLTEDVRGMAASELSRTVSAYLINQGRVGRSGVEADFDAELRGQSGVHWLMRSRRTLEEGLWSIFDVSPGEDVHLTIDVRIQTLLEQAMDEALLDSRPKHGAAIVVIDPLTGDVLAAVSRRDVRADKNALDPLINWTSTGYVGSLTKPLLLLEHLDARRHNRSFLPQNQLVPCQGKRPLEGPGRYRLTCDHEHGVLDASTSLGESCNHYFYQVAEGVGVDGLVRAYSRFGLHRPDSDALPASYQTRVQGVDRRAYWDPQWDLGRGVHRLGIGYGISANVLQMARAYAGIATGRLPELSFVRREDSQLRFTELGLDPSDLDVVREGLRYCAVRGTAEDLELVDAWVKTGTAEVSGAGDNNAWLAGYIGGERPRLAFASVAYFVPQGDYGAEVAGPMFRNFLRRVREDPELSEEYL